MSTTLHAMSGPEFVALKERLWAFMVEHVYPNEVLFHQQCKDIGESSNEWMHPPILVDLMEKARELGLWNLFLPIDSAAAAGEQGLLGGGLTNRQYAELCEIMGTSS